MEQAHASGNGKGNRTAEYGSGNNARIPPDFRRVSERFGHLIPAHVNGQNRTEHGWVLMQCMIDGNDHFPDGIGEYRGKTDNAGHAQSNGAEHGKAFFKGLSKTEAVAQYPVQTAQQCADGHEYHQNPYHSFLRIDRIAEGL